MGKLWLGRGGHFSRTGIGRAVRFKSGGIASWSTPSDRTGDGLILALAAIGLNYLGERKHRPGCE